MCMSGLRFLRSRGVLYYQSKHSNSNLSREGVVPGEGVGVGYSLYGPIWGGAALEVHFFTPDSLIKGPIFTIGPSLRIPL